MRVEAFHDGDFASAVVLMDGQRLFLILAVVTAPILSLWVPTLWSRGIRLV